MSELAGSLLGLEGKVAIVTGGAKGIGRAAAEMLVRAGAQVAILDIDSKAGEAAAAGINAGGFSAAFFRCDVTSSAQVEAVVRSVAERFGRIDILFNNAGVAIRKSTTALSEGEWDTALSVNLKGIYLLSRSVIEHMRRAGGGSIINTGSGWSLRGGPNAVSYCASKGGVLNMTRAMAIDHGPEGIRVNCVCPGDVDTDLLHSECEQLGLDEESFMQSAADRPLGRVGSPEDVARAVLFFAGPMSTWVTGAYLVVDGGGLA